MTIGLTMEQLFKVFIDSLLTRQKQFQAEIITAEIGLNPETNKIISLLREKYADVLSVDQFNIISIIAAFMDSIVSNNNELAKILQHQT